MEYQNKKIKIAYSTIALFMLIFHAFMSVFAQYYQANFVTRLGYWIIVILLMLFSKSGGITKYKINANMVLSLLMLIVILSNNQNFENGNYTYELMFVALVCFLTLSLYATSWYGNVLRFVKLFTRIHIVCTLWLSIDKWSYFNIVLPIIGNKYTVDTLVYQYKHGWMPGIASHYSANAIYLSYAVGLFFILVMTEEIKKKRICHLVWLIAAIIALLLTGKRGHIIFTAAALVFLFYFYMSNHKRGRIIKILFALSLVIMLVFVVSMFVPYILLFLERFVEQAQLGDITSGRVYLQELALQMFNKSRLFGIGWDGFKYKYLGSISIDAVMLNVHNVYIQLLTECGIVGALPFYVFFLSNGFKAVQSLVKMVKRPDEEKSILVLRNVMFAVFVELFFLMYCLTGNPLYDEQTLILYIVGCSIVQKPLNVEIYRSDTMRKDEISFGEI